MIGVREPPIPADALLRACAAAHGQLPVGQLLAVPHGQLLGVHGQQFVELPKGSAGSSSPLALALGLRDGAALGDYGPVQVDHRHAVAVHDLDRLLVVFDDHVVDGFVVQHRAILATLARRQQSN